jgi:hypothetical protein
MRMKAVRVVSLIVGFSHTVQVAPFFGNAIATDNAMKRAYASFFR